MKREHSEHRSGHQGTVGAYDANGFGTFYSRSGAVFTVHRTEVIAPDATRAQEREARKRWATWPASSYRIAVERPAQGEPVLIVARL
jgi:hypothetical protein